MSVTDWVAIIAGAAALAGIYWWFFGVEQAAASAVAGATGIQEIEVVVAGGYTPATVRVKSGQPVRLVFDRQDTSACSEEIVLPDFGIKRFLPAHERTVIDVTPERPGTYDFTCGMNMLHGRMIAE